MDFKGNWMQNVFMMQTQNDTYQKRKKCRCLSLIWYIYDFICIQKKQQAYCKINTIWQRWIIKNQVSAYSLVWQLNVFKVQTIIGFAMSLFFLVYNCLHTGISGGAHFSQKGQLHTKERDNDRSQSAELKVAIKILFNSKNNMFNIILWMPYFINAKYKICMFKQTCGSDVTVTC